VSFEGNNNFKHFTYQIRAATLEADSAGNLEMIVYQKRINISSKLMGVGD
jgi:hypothetical protein